MGIEGNSYYLVLGFDRQTDAEGEHRRLSYQDVAKALADAGFEVNVSTWEYEPPVSADGILRWTTKVRKRSAKVEYVVEQL